MGTQGTGRKRNSKKEKSTAEDDALNLIAREAEARLAAKRAARAEAREIRMRELERQQKEEDSERYSRSRPSQPHTLSDEDDRMSVGSRGSLRSDRDAGYGAGGSSLLSHKSKKKKKHKNKEKDRNGHDDEYSVLSSRASYSSSDLYNLNGLSGGRNLGSTGSFQTSLYEESLCSGSRRASDSNSGFYPLEYSSYRSTNSRTSSRANSARTSPVENCGSVASLLRSTSSSRGLPRDLDDVTIPDFSDVDDRDYLERGSRSASALTATTLTSLGGNSSRRGSVETAITIDAETASREIKEIHELKDQIQDVESKYTQNLKEVKDTLTEVEEKYRKAMVSNAQLDNEKSNLMYQVDTLKDSLTELEELLSESRREYEEKVKEFEREKHAHSVLQFQFNEMKETLKQSEELLNEIRQLRMKQEGFAREITDLQETVEWKDKKIGALERQKEYTDAIRNERDELREEVVKLKDILKKHGIVLGPDLSINGDAGVTEIERISGDAAPQPPQGSPTSTSEGNSMLGSSEETRLRSSGKEEMEQEQRREVFWESQTSHQSTDKFNNVDDASRPIKENESCLSQGLQTELPVTKAMNEIVLSAVFRGNATDLTETVSEVNSNLEGTDTQIHHGDIEEYSKDIKKQPNKHETNQKTEPFEQALKNNESHSKEDLKDHVASCQIDFNESGSCLKDEIQDSESFPHEEISDSQPCRNVDVIEFKSCSQENVQDSESCSEDLKPNSEPCPNKHGLNDPEKNTKDTEINPHVAAKDPGSWLQEDLGHFKSYPKADVNDFESCSKEVVKDPDPCPQIDVTDSESTQESMQDVKNSQLGRQREDVNNSNLCSQEENSELCSQVLDLKDSDHFPEGVYPESNAELQHKTAEGSSDEAEKILTKPLSKSANAPGKRKKKKKRGKRKGSSPERNQQREKKDENVGDEENNEITSTGVASVNNGSTTESVTDGHTIEILKEPDVCQADTAKPVEHSENSNVPKDSKMDQMFNMHEQNIQQLEAGSIQILEQETSIDTHAGERKVSLELMGVEEGFIQCSEPVVSHSGTDLLFDCEGCEEDSLLDGTSAKFQGHDNKMSLGVVHEGVTSSENTVFTKEAVAEFIVQNHVDKPILKPSESQNEVSVTPTQDIGDSLQDPGWLPSAHLTAVNSDTLIGFSENDLEEKTLINQEYKEPEAECADHEEMLDLVKLENSCDLNTEQILGAPLVESESSLLFEKQVVETAFDTGVQASESEEACCVVSNEEKAYTEDPKEPEKSQSHQNVNSVDTCRQNSREDVKEKEQSFDFDDNDIDTPVLELQTHENPEKRKVEVCALDVLTDERSTDIKSAIETLKDREGCTHVATLDNKCKQTTLVDMESSPDHLGTDQEVTSEDTYKQGSGEEVDDEDEKGHSFDFDDMDIDAAMEKQTVENPDVREVEVGSEEVHSDQLLATPDKCEQTTLVDMESSSEHLGTVNDVLESRPRDQEATSEETYKQGSGDDVEDEDEKGQSFDFDDMDIDAAVEKQTVENPDAREVEVGSEEVHSDQLVATPDKCEQTTLVDMESSPEHLGTVNDRLESHPDDQEVTFEDTYKQGSVEEDDDDDDEDEKGQSFDFDDVDIDAPTEMQTVENPDPCNVEVGSEEVHSDQLVAKPDSDMESTPKHLETLNNDTHEQSYTTNEREPYNTGVSESAKNQTPFRSTSLEVLDAVEKPKDLSSTHRNGDTPPSGKERKKNGKKSKSKDDCKMT
ncbi:uncharacterized protein lrrfip1a isoform X5 [Corythoichthys intestinalis]|uniref:uncharacterized protein lrrfip1a isoform X5 n=1 Tax=Corythoichthys intestinalis TaxID=161448 RepID=UPI0025A609DF|nr:uncharacterized protein lrrfip1a isoform X5 [Corythoichthys intestinalis]